MTNAPPTTSSLQDLLTQQPSAFIHSGDQLAALMTKQAELETEVARNPQNCEALNLLGIIYSHKGKLAQSEQCYKRSLQLTPQQPITLCNLGKLYRKMMKIEAAIWCFNQALKLDASDIIAYMELGSALWEMGRWPQAVKVYELVLKLQPNHLEASSMLALTWLSAGEKQKAADLCRRMLSVYPGHPDFLLTLVKTNCPEANDPVVSDALRVYEADETPPYTRHLLAFTLGKLFDALGDYDRAFSFFAEGARLKLQELNKTSESIKAEYDGFYQNIIRSFPADTPAPAALFPPETMEVVPVFIVGMPRSGTSLVEQILASHSNVYGAGELSYLQQFAIHGLQAGNKPYPAGMENWRAMSPDACAAIVRGYLEKIANHKLSRPHAEYITDKLPNNFHYIGLIREMFPKAVIVHCVRNPMDTCLSIFQQNFKGYHPYAYDLSALGHYYNHYRKLMAHWHRYYPGCIYDVSYEALTANPQEEIPKLADACGLSMEDAMLSPHKTERDTRTASAGQVNEPIHQSSVERWKRYESHLAPLKAALETTD